MSNFTASWQSASRGVWEYWNKVFGTVEGVQAFGLRDCPRTIIMPVMPKVQAVEAAFMWRFKMGGGEKVLRQNRVQITGGAWKMPGILEAWCIKEDMAFQIGGLIEDNDPITGTDVPGIARCYAINHPDYEDAVISISGADDAGQEVLGVRIWSDMVCAFGNMDRVK